MPANENKKHIGLLYDLKTFFPCYNKCAFANNFFQSTYAADTLRACQDLARADRGSEGQLSAGRPHPRHQRTHLSLHLVKRGPPFRLRQVWILTKGLFFAVHYSSYLVNKMICLEANQTTPHHSFHLWSQCVAFAPTIGKQDL